MSLPTVELPEGDDLIKVVYVNCNGYRNEYICTKAELARRINQELRQWYAQGKCDKLFEIQRLLEIK